LANPNTYATLSMRFLEESLRWPVARAPAMRPSSPG